MCEQLTFLKLKYGNKSFSLNILKEIPVAVVINSYKKYVNENTSMFCDTELTDNKIIDIISNLIEKHRNNPNSRFSQTFSDILAYEIKKYYERTSNILDY